MADRVSLASGSAGSRDRIDVAVDAIEYGDVDYIAFDVMAEQTLPGQVSSEESAATGYDPLLAQRMRAVLPVAHEHGVKVLGNFGALNPTGAAREVAAECSRLGLHDHTVGVVTGDDVTDIVRSDFDTYFGGENVAPENLITAKAYLGAGPLVDCLDRGADIVVTGRVADSSLYLAPLIHEFGWRETDWDRIGAGAIIGHVLECGALATGANWQNLTARPVPGLERIGGPIADVSVDLDVQFRRPKNTGGVTAVANLSAQLMHEINDPAHYLTPDVDANLLSIGFSQRDGETVDVRWTGDPRGTERPEKLKILGAFSDGYIGEVILFLPGPRAAERAEFMEPLVRARMAQLGLPLQGLRFDYVGSPRAENGDEPRGGGGVLRIAAKAETQDVAHEFARFGEYVIVMGPMALGERRWSVKPAMNVVAALMDRELVKAEVRTIEVRAAEVTS
jgi:hypothetical protein